MPRKWWMSSIKDLQLRYFIKVGFVEISSDYSSDFASLSHLPSQGKARKTPHLRRQSEYANHRFFGGLSALPVTCPYRAEQATGLAGGHDCILK